MKSLSRIYAGATQEELKSWDLSALDIELAVAPQEIDKEQIRALFGSGSEQDSIKQDNGSHPALHRGGGNLVLSTWQLEEIDSQPPLPLTVEKDWLLDDFVSDVSETPEEEIWKEEAKPEKETNPEKECAAILEQARTQAEEILLQAQAQADQLILRAQESIEQEKKNGYEQGWNEARNELQETLRATNALVDEIRKWQTEFMSQGEQTMIEMLKEIAQTMFGEGVQLDANALQINLNRIMENAQRLGDLNIFLNPRDANLLDPSWKEYQYLISGNKVRIIPSEKITPGGCIIKGSTGMVDGRVETQLEAILKTFDELRETAQ